jgi:hypothetical protein
VAGSSLLLDETFAAEDERFLAELLAFTADKRLQAWAAKLTDDKRPFARRMLVAYIDDGCDRDHHRPLVKRTFKLAEKAKDDELMGHFMVAFDRLTGRTVRQLRSWQGGGWVLAPEPLPPHESGFRRGTRAYLKRRAWRYFRQLGFKDEARYGRAIRAALALYRDEHLGTAERVLDSWGLVHALYHGSPVLRRDPRGVVLRDGATLAELRPAPFREGAWLGVRDELLDLVVAARSRTVRAWTIGWLRARYQLDGIPIARALGLLRSPDEEAQQLGVEILRSSRELDGLPIAVWLELLAIENPSVTPVICELAAARVAPGRLSVADCVTLAQRPAAPVAELGWRWLRERRGLEVGTVLGLGDASTAAVRESAVGWLLERIRAPEELRDLIDARHADVRTRALDAMNAEPFRDAEALWTALPESPYDDVRARLLAHLEARRAALPAGSLRHVWVTALLAIQRGSKAKPDVARQIARRIVEKPAEAAELMPLLAIALRSLRQPERRAALAALVRAAESRPELRAELANRFPELAILDDAATAAASVSAGGGGR